MYLTKICPISCRWWWLCPQFKQQMGNVQQAWKREISLRTHNSIGVYNVFFSSIHKIGGNKCTLCPIGKTMKHFYVTILVPACGRMFWPNRQTDNVHFKSFSDLLVPKSCLKKFGFRHVSCSVFKFCGTVYGIQN